MTDQSNMGSVAVGMPEENNTFSSWRGELAQRSEQIVALIKTFEETRGRANRDLNYEHFKPADFSNCTGEVATPPGTVTLDLTTHGDIRGGPDDTVQAPSEAPADEELTDEEKQEKAEKAKQHLQDLFMPALPSVDDVVAKTMKVCEDVGIEDPVERGAIFRTLAGRHNL